MVCLFGIVWFQKLSIPPPQKEFFLRPPPPTSLEIPVKLHIFTQIFGPLGIPPPPPSQEFPIPSVGEYGYFLELHIDNMWIIISFWETAHLPLP